MKIKEITFTLIVLICSVCCFGISKSNGKDLNVSETKPESDQNLSQHLVDNGIAMDFFIKPLPATVNLQDKKSLTSDNIAETLIDYSTLNTGEAVLVNFQVSDVFTHSPVKGLLPDSFVQFKPVNGTPESIKISLKRGRFRALKRGRMNNGHAPLLESIHLVSLNSFDNSLTLINPMIKPQTIIKRINIGEKCNDLSLEEYGSDLYVTCEAGKVVIIDCQRFEEAGRIDVGAAPYHIEFQPDGRYVWVGNDGDGSVSIIDTVRRELVKHLKTGKGHHEFTFKDDSSFVYVTNQEDDSVTVIDIARLKVIQTIKVGKRPHGLVYSKLSQCVYVANEGGGNVAVLDTITLKVIKTIFTGKGVRSVVFGDDERFCFSVNKMDNTVSVIDTSKDVVIKNIQTGIRPEGIVISEKYAYVRNTGSPDVTLIDMEKLERVKEIHIGLSPPNSVNLSNGHLDIGISYMVIVPDPVDNIVYTIMVGDTDTAFKYRLQGKGPSKVAFYWIGLKETSPGIYSRVVKFDKPGRYEIGMYIGSPEVTACFAVNVVQSKK